MKEQDSLFEAIKDVLTAYIWEEEIKEILIRHSTDKAAVNFGKYYDVVNLIKEFVGWDLNII